MKNPLKSSLYPGAHVKYAVDIFGVTFEPFSCNPPNKKVKEVTFEKEEPGNPLNTKCFMTFHFGPVSSLEEAKKISELEKESLLDIASFEMLAKIGKPRYVEHNLMPRLGEGAQFHGIIPPLQMQGAGFTGDREVNKGEIKNIQEHIKHTASKNERLLRLFRWALLIDDAVSQFLVLYLILDVKIGVQHNAQQKIDDLLRSLNSTIEESPNPRKLICKETCYTRLRNEIIHRGTDPEETFGEILERSYDFKHLVKLAIKA
jgi:hypothetical protein